MQRSGEKERKERTMRDDEDQARQLEDEDVEDVTGGIELPPAPFRGDEAPTII